MQLLGTVTRSRKVTRHKKVVSRGAVVLSSIALGLASGFSTATPQAFAQTTDTVTTAESKCYEVDIPRAANYDNLANLLKPTGYTPLKFPGPSGDVGKFFFIDYGCKQVSIDGQSAQRTTTSLVVAAVEGGKPYILEHATNNQQLADRYSALGLPSKYQQGTTSTFTGGTRGYWSIVGDGLDHWIDGIATMEVPESPISESTTNFVYKTDTGQKLELTYHNSLRPLTDAQVKADFRQATRLASLFATPTLQTIPPQGDTRERVRFPQAFVLGDWNSTLQQTSSS